MIILKNLNIQTKFPQKNKNQKNTQQQKRDKK